MIKRVTAVCTAALLVAFTAAAAGPVRRAEYAGGVRWTVERPERDADRISLRGRMRAGRDVMPGVAARNALRATASILDIDGNDVDDLALVRSRKSLTATHLTFETRAGDVPVDGGRVNVHVDNGGDVRLVTARRSRFHGISRPRFVRSAEDAVDAAMQSVGVEGGLRGEVTVRRLAYPGDDKSVRAGWRVCIPASEPLGDWDALIDDATLDVVEIQDRIRYATGKGLVFDPNPVVTLRDSTLEDMNDSKRAVPETEYEEKTLEGLDGTGRLDGPYVTTEPTGSNRAYSPFLSFKYDREDDRFEEVMAYYHIDSYQRYIQNELGFDDVCNKQIQVAANGVNVDNSYYSPDEGITLGGGDRAGVDDGEDADIIIHEYGHAIQHDVVPNFGSSQEAAAMGEGISDYLAASYFADRGYTPTYIAEWDARGYTPPAFYLRRVDTDLVYDPDTFHLHEEHHNGQIWSSALWSVRSALGQKTTDRLVIESIFWMPDNVTFLEGLEAMLFADEQLNGGENTDIIRTAFALRGIVALEPIDGDVFTQDERPDLAIPDNHPVPTVSELYVPTDVDITGLTVAVHITHTFIGDLQVLLRSPWGTSVTLHDYTGGEGDNLHVTYGVDRQPDSGSLSDFAGHSSKGTWSLRVRDMEEDDVGTLDSWQLEIAPKAPPPPPPPPTIATNGGTDFITETQKIHLEGITSTETVSITVNGSTDGVVYESGNVQWRFNGELELGENSFEIVATGEGGPSGPSQIAVTYEPRVRSKYDINDDGIVDAVDLQKVINSVLDLPLLPGDYDPDVNEDGKINALDIQSSINEILGVWS